jgi:hypothetical protein
MLLEMLAAVGRGLGWCDHGNHCHRRRVHGQRQKPDRKFAHASLLRWVEQVHAEAHAWYTAPEQTFQRHSHQLQFLVIWNGRPPNSATPSPAGQRAGWLPSTAAKAAIRRGGIIKKRWIAFLVRPQYDRRRGLRYQRLAEFILLLARDREADAKPVDRCQRNHSLGGIG